MRAIFEIARRQLGLITWAQAIQLVSPMVLRRMVREGTLERVRTGVYAVGGMPPSYARSVLAALLAAGDRAWASHRTAARLWGLRVPQPEQIDVLTLPDRRIRLDGVAHHRNQLIVHADVTIHEAVPITSVARTLVDCLPWLPASAAGRAVDDALRRGLLTVAALEAAHASVDEGRRTGRRLVRPMRPVLRDRLAGQLPGGSDRELDVLRILRRAGLPLPTQQYRVVVGGRERVLDYAYPVVKLYLEFDGFAEHGVVRSTFDDDRERDAELALAGWLGLRFTSNTRPADLVRRVDMALRQRAA